MTLIVGIDLEIKGNKLIYLAGDRCGSNGFTKDQYVKPKVFKRDNYAFGYTSSFRMGQILEYAKISKDLPSWEDESNLYVSFVDWAKSAMKDGGFLEDKSGKTSGGNFIFFNGKLLSEVQDNFSILIPIDGLIAVGSGENHAKAIMRAYMELVKMNKTIFDIDTLLNLVFDTVSSLITTVSKEHDVICLVDDNKSQ
jgi:ATP-dependent protease HslVU (ClpYQ) peptidase subunit